MLAADLRRVDLNDRPLAGGDLGCAITGALVATGLTGFLGVRPAAQMLLAATGDTGECLGIALNPNLETAMRDELLRGFNLKFGACVDEASDGADNKFENFAANGGSIRVIKIGSTSQDLDAISKGI